MERGVVTLELQKEEHDYPGAPEPARARQRESVPEEAPAESAISKTNNETETRLELEITARIEKQYKEKYEKLVTTLEEKNKELAYLIENVTELVNHLPEKFETFLETEQENFEPALIGIVFDAISKILGNKGVNDDYINRVVKDLLRKHREKEKFRLKVPIHTHDLIKAILKEDTFINDVLFVDKDLNEGQLIFESESCVKEVGLIDRFEVVKAALIEELRKNAATAEL